MCTEQLILDGTADYDETCRTLLSIPHIGPWTGVYIAMRGLGNPDAFTETDLQLMKRIKQYDFNPAQWTPWRAYAAVLLFILSSGETS